MIRHNVVNQIAEGVEIVRAFQGSSSELLAHMMRLWWERVGETRASGILKLMMSEVRNFPEIAQFYIDEVTTPCDRMLAEIVERGIARGEFRPVEVADVVHALIGRSFLVMNKHCWARAPRSPARPKAISSAHDLVLRIEPGRRVRAAPAPMAAAGGGAAPAPVATQAERSGSSRRPREPS